MSLNLGQAPASLLLPGREMQEIHGEICSVSPQRGLGGTGVCVLGWTSRGWKPHHKLEIPEDFPRGKSHPTAMGRDLCCACGHSLVSSQPPRDGRAVTGIKQGIVSLCIPHFLNGSHSRGESHPTAMGRDLCSAALVAMALFHLSCPRFMPGIKQGIVSIFIPPFPDRLPQQMG